MESITKTESEKKLLELCEQTIGPRGFRAVDVDFRIAGRSLVRIFIERMMDQARAESADIPVTERDSVSETGGNVSIEDCAEVSRTLGPLLEAGDLLPGAFDLEVSSPGLDRRLRLRADFERVIGENVKLKLDQSIPGLGANPTGKLLSVEKDFILMECQGKEVRVAFTSMMRAIRVWQPKQGPHDPKGKKS